MRRSAPPKPTAREEDEDGDGEEMFVGSDGALVAPEKPGKSSNGAWKGPRGRMRRRQASRKVDSESVHGAGKEESATV